MRFIKRLAGKAEKKSSWTQPNFWSVPSFMGNGLSGNREWIENDFTAYVQQIYKDNGVAYACIQTRAMVFSEARFQFQRMRQGMPSADSPKLGEGDKKPAPFGAGAGLPPKPGGQPKADNSSSKQPQKPGDKPKPKRPADAKKPGEGNKPKPRGSTTSAMSLFGTEDLKILDEPWPGGTTGQLLWQMDVDVSVAGNSYWTHTNDKGQFGKAAREAGKAAQKAARSTEGIDGKKNDNPLNVRLVRLRPDFVQIIIHSKSGNPWALDARVKGYLYRPYGFGVAGGNKDHDVLLLPEEVAHYAPIQDPEAHFRGMSWLTPVIRELGGDKNAMNHKNRFFKEGATLGHVVSLSEEVGQEDFEYFVQKFKEEHEGVDNAYKTLVLGGGADVVPVGVDLKQLDFTQTQGHGETRIAAASGVPPVIVGLSEGLQAATYANYAQARRRFADGTLRPLWRMACGALSTLVDVPDDARLWFDDRDIAFLRDDQKDEAEISEIDARAYKALVESGLEPDAAAEYLMTRDPAVLMGQHSGLVSVQLLPPGTPQPMMGPGGPGGQPGGSGPGGGPSGGGGSGGPKKPGSPSSGSQSPNKPKPKPSASKPASGRKRYVR